MTYDPRGPDAAPRASQAHRRRGIGNAARVGLVVFAALVVLGAVGATAAVAGFMSLSKDLPDPARLEHIELQQQSVIYDRSGKTELARFGDFNREVVTFDEIPPVLVDATTAVEDRTFWENAGFDPVGILAAGVDALRGNARGASTITQQLVRQRLLTTDGVAQTQLSAERKLREIVQSIRVTQAFPGEAGKQRIMAAYLNQNYYGNESYGVKAAAKGYFGVELKDLTLAQAAIIAAIPKAPSSYDLVQNAEVECIEPGATEDTCAKSQLVVPSDAPIVQRRNQVLNLMEQGRTPLTGSTFTAADYDAAREEPVVLAPQTAPKGLAPQFVLQVRRELTEQLCGPETDTCPVLERGGLTITSTLDLRLQGIAETWVKAAAIVPHAKDPAAAAKKLGLTYASWMRNLRSKDLRNGALVAEDYQTGELVAYVGSADATAQKATKKFQPQFDVLADGWRQPGSAFKPFLYATGIDGKQITAASMFMDVVTDFGGGYVPTDADNLERGPVRVRNALQFSLNIPAVKAMAVIGNDRVRAKAQDMGVEFLGEPNAGLAFALGTEEVHPVDLVAAYGTLADAGRHAQQTTIITVADSDGKKLIALDDRPDPTQAIGAGAAGIVTDILAGNTDPRVNPFWGKFELTSSGKHRPATLKTGTNNDARDLNAYGYIGAPSSAEREKGEYALAVGVWNGNSDNSLVSTARAPLFSIDVSTHVWHGFLQQATRGWSINTFKLPDGLERAQVNAWTGLTGPDGSKSVRELFLAGTAPSGAPAGAECGEAVLLTAGFEHEHDSWMKADQGWLARAERGSGVRGGPKNTRTAYFYNGLYAPYGRSWGPLVGGACGSPSPSASIDPCASPLGSVDPSASPDVACPSPSESVGPSEIPSPSTETTPTEPPAPTPTEPPPTEPPTPTPTPEPPTPSPPPATPSPAAS